ncbi:MAG TPA: NAD(P)H-hydrate epimerase [Elusimicrobiales bacterium]|nr:NAD(P)H-hydrate epimerase [Elusimicrobiales bacterium]
MDKLPIVTAAQMRAIDRLAIEKYGLPGWKLMENAGRSIATEILLETQNLHAKGCVIMCGRGNNGGDGLVCARCLKAAGIPTIAYVSPASLGNYSELCTVNLEKAKTLGLEVRELKAGDSAFEEALKNSACVVDALLGTGVKGAPEELYAYAINAANASGARIAAVDIPSGLDADTGAAHSPCIKAAITYTLGLAKKGLMEQQAEPYVGELEILDIGFQEHIIREVLDSVPQQ